MKYFVESKFYDNGKVEGRMWLEGENPNLDLRPYVEENLCDRYLDVFPTYEKADAFLRDLKNA